MNRNVRTGIALVCAALIGGLLLLLGLVAEEGEASAVLTGVGAMSLTVFGAIGLIAVALGVLQRD